MILLLLDESLKVDVFFDAEDDQYEDNICLRFEEDCPEPEQLFRYNQTNVYITPAQACALAQALLKAARCSDQQAD
jgi:hypothetical protein